MRAYSVDLRERVVRACDSGMSVAAIARTFNIGHATVRRYLQQRQERGTLAPKPIPGRPALIPRGQYPDLVAQLGADDDATLAEHCRLWERSHGVKVSEATMCRAIANTGWTRKKRR
ncbi:MAG: IS630 transposase-related protein [Chloroflexi bacterium]|nr:IS630 transposase-related protein [Chloroflexota bacterium]